MKKKIFAFLIMGLLVFTLASCGKKHEHQYSNWQIVQAATCEDSGLKQRTCGSCGNVERVSIPALGHNFVNGRCTVCGEKE